MVDSDRTCFYACLCCGYPYDLTVEVSDKLFKNITSNQAKIKQEPNYLKTIVRAELMPYVHVKYAGSKVLGKILKPLHQNKEKILTAFEQYIEQTYAQVLTLYSDQKLEIEKPKTDATENRQYSCESDSNR